MKARFLVAVVLALLLSACTTTAPAAPAPAVTVTVTVTEPARITEPHPDFVVTPGDRCPYEGLNGATLAGTPMRCVRWAGEDKPRWRPDNA